MRSDARAVGAGNVGVPLVVGLQTGYDRARACAGRPAGTRWVRSCGAAGVLAVEPSAQQPHWSPTMAAPARPGRRAVDRLPP